MNANHRPPKFAPTKKRRSPSRIKMNATACPTRAASFVECSALPVTHHATATQHATAVERVSGNHVEAREGEVETQAVSFVPMQGSAMTYAMKHLHVFQFQIIPWFGAVSSHVLLYARPQKGQCVRPAQKDLCASGLFL